MKIPKTRFLKFGTTPAKRRAMKPPAPPRYIYPVHIPDYILWEMQKDKESRGCSYTFCIIKALEAFYRVERPGKKDE